MNKRINVVLVVTSVTAAVSLLVGLIVNENYILDVIGQILLLLSLMLLTHWAVLSSKKSVSVLGSIFLLISTLLLFTRTTDYIALCACIILMVAATLKKKNKLLFVLPLAILSILKLYEILIMLSYGFRLHNLLIYSMDRIFTIAFFVALCIYVMADGKPFDKKMVLRREYIHPRPSKNVSLAEQLNQIKGDFESGKITADEYRQQRITLLRKAGK